MRRRPSPMPPRPAVRAAWLHALSIGAALLGGAGCAPHTPAPVAVAAHAAADPRVQLILTPAAPRALDLTRFAVHVAGRDGKPVSGASVTADLTMPGMAMPPSTVTLAPAAPGVYTGYGRFSMPDQWLVTITVTSRGRRIVPSFPVQVR